MSWDGSSWGLVLVGGLLELDATLFGQFMIGRPLVLGPILGWFFNDPWLGAGLGFLCEFFCLDREPVGGSLPPNATIAIVASLIFIQGSVAAAVAFPVAMFLAWSHSRLETWLRRRPDQRSAAVLERLNQARPPRLGKIIAQALGKQAVFNISVLSGALLCRPALAWAWGALPLSAKTGLDIAFAFSPWMAVAVLLRSLRRRAL